MPFKTFMQSSRKHIHMCHPIRPYRHIDTSSMKTHQYTLADKNIHMLFPIKTHRHINTSSHENILKHHIKQCYICLSFVLIGFCFWCPGTLCRWSYTYLFLMPQGPSTWWSFTWSAKISFNLSLTFNVNDFLLFLMRQGSSTQWFYTWSAKISFNFGLTFSVNDIVSCSCSNHHAFTFHYHTFNT
jgi:hypothetical protein